jgi:hypothetical protein
MNNDDMNGFWNLNNPIYTTFTTSSFDSYGPSVTYTVSVDGSSFSIGPDLEAIYNKADKEFDELEDQTSLAKQMLNDIGITWNEE